jgi:hypothetical protein
VPDFGGILSADDTVNPGFSQDHHIFVKYCDGSSFTGEREEQINVRGRDLWFRGRSNLVAVIDTLFSKSEYGLDNATEVIMTGSSAGGLAVYMNLDFVSEYLK